MRRGTEALAAGGGARARLAAIRTSIDQGLLRALLETGGRLGTALAVRSSSPMEADGVWAGAFASYIGIAPEELPTAVRGCWASMFAPTVLERLRAEGSPLEQLAMAVLVQQALVPRAGGAARVEPDGMVNVTGVQGSPADLLAGWEAGHDAWVAASGALRGSAAVELLGARCLRQVASMALAVRREMGCDLVEWADSGDGILLLQAGRAARGAPPSDLLDAGRDEFLTRPEALKIARLVTRYPGPVGEALVLPWALGMKGLVEPPGPLGMAVEAALAEARSVALELAEMAWGEPAERALALAARTLSDLRRSRPAAFERVHHLRSPDLRRAERVLALINTIGQRLMEQGALTRAAEVWHLKLERLARLARSRPRGRVGPARGHAGAWEPLIYGAVRAQGRRLQGTPASPGIATGLASSIRTSAAGTPLQARHVVVAAHPFPSLSPLLWSAAGIATEGGSPSAHLTEVARSLHLPAVVGCGSLLEAAPAGALVAVDGSTGVVHVATG